MSFTSTLLGSGGGGGKQLGFDIINAYGSEEQRLKDAALKFDDLARLADEETKSLGKLQEQRMKMSPNPWITSGAGQVGIAGTLPGSDSRSLGYASTLGG